MRNKAGVIIEKGQKVALSHASIYLHPGAMHGIALPKVIRKFHLKLAPVYGVSLGWTH
jgi:hypothetical protein